MGGNLRIKMNNKEKQQIILQYYPSNAQAHKEEVMKGCGEEFIVHGDTYSCGRDTIMLCPTCQAIIDKYKENGI